MKKYVAELLGTFVLLFAGLGTAVLTAPGSFPAGVRESDLNRAVLLRICVLVGGVEQMPFAYVRHVLITITSFVVV